MLVSLEWQRRIEHCGRPQRFHWPLSWSTCPKPYTALQARRGSRCDALRWPSCSGDDATVDGHVLLARRRHMTSHR
jgi:hypothetical protein